MACLGLILSEEPSAHVKLRQGNNYSAGYMEQAPSKGHEASPQRGLGVCCKGCSSSKKNLRRLSARAQARRKSMSLSFSVAFFFE